VVAPAGTPATALQRLSTAFGQALARAEVRERLQALAIEPVTQSDPEQFSAFFASELRRWAALAKVAGLQAH
jgi:tripartite-type tricarboxylate transporter receptor subunit TctC